jgi:hypothetical protein
VGHNLLAGRNPLYCLVSNFSSRKNSMLFARVYAALWQAGVNKDEAELPSAPRRDMIDIWETGMEQFRRLAAAFKQQATWFFRQS